MIKVHRPDDAIDTVVEFPDCGGWEVTSQGAFVVKKGGEPMAIFAAHQWSWAEDRSTERPTPEQSTTEGAAGVSG